MRRILPNLICFGVAVLAFLLGSLISGIWAVMLPLTIAAVAFGVTLGMEEDGNYLLFTSKRSLVFCCLCFLTAVFALIQIFTPADSLISYTLIVVRTFLMFLAIAVAAAALLIRLYRLIIRGQMPDFHSLWAHRRVWLLLDVIFACLACAVWLLKR